MDTKTPEEEHPRKAFGWAAMDSSGVLSPFHFSRRCTGDDDIRVKILFCGVCHTDLHCCRNEWGITQYPLIPGHEIVGIVAETGMNVTNFKLGDRVGVGVLVNSCKSCHNCNEHLEIYCPRSVFTYNFINYDGTITYGGYSDTIVVDHRYVLRFPDALPPDAGAPLLCAGITVYSPMKYYDMAHPGKSLGVVGLGGLGHLAVKIAKAFGLRVTVISRSPEKENEAIQRLGADAFIVSSDAQRMSDAAGTLDFVMDTVSAVHPLAPLLTLLKTNGKLVVLGLPPEDFQLSLLPLVMGRKLIGGSDVGGLKETQEMLDFCAQHNIAADVEVIRMDQINEAMERLSAADVRFRFVINVADSLSIT